MVSHYRVPSPFYCGTGCDSGSQLNLLNVVALFGFEPSHPLLFPSPEVHRGTLGPRGRFILLPWAETRLQSPSSCTCLPSVRLEAFLSFSPCWDQGQGCQSACVTSWYQASVSPSACWIHLSLMTSPYSLVSCLKRSSCLPHSLRWLPDSRAPTTRGLGISCSSEDPSGSMCQPTEVVAPQPSCCGW